MSDETPKRLSIASIVPVMSKVEWLTFAFSGLAIIISLFGYFESRRAGDIAERSFLSNERIVWRIDVEDKDYVFRDPNENVLGQQIVVHVPEDLGGDVWNLMVSDRRYPITRIDWRVAEALRAYVKEEEGVAKITTVGVPVLVESYFYANGQTHEDRSIYFLNMTVQVPEPGGVWTVTPTSALFSTRVSSNASPIEILEQVWTQMLTVVFVAQFESQ